MKSLRFQEILLLSRPARSARRIVLDPNVTIVLGKNDTGKSALLKSIYWTFGAGPAVVQPRWLAAEVIGLVKFTVDDVSYTILRSDGFYAVFDGAEQLLLATDKVLSGLGPFLAELLDYRIVVTTLRGNQTVPPPPQHFFLPFYIDQDKGWTENWSSFALLSQVRDWRRSIVEFHVGIRPNEYYTAKAALAAAQNDLRHAKSDVAALERMLVDVRQDITPTFDVSLESFQTTVKQLLEECNNLKGVEELLSNKLNELYSRRFTLQTQIGIAGASLKEVTGDYRFATEGVAGSHVECPTCGAVYSNSFAERFAIAQDEDRLSDLILHLRGELQTVEAEIETLSSEHSNRRADIQRITALLEERQGEITVRTLIQSEGKKEVNLLLRNKVEAVRERAAEEDGNVNRLRLRLKDFDDPDRTDRIVGLYHTLMRSYLHELKVVTLRERMYRQIWANIAETGSDLPRALLAYYFSILSVMEVHASSTFCPVVIDSPNRQGQDQESLTTVLRFIRDRRPQDAQMILAIEEPWGVDFGGSVIELTNSYRLLSDEQFDEVSGIVSPLLTRALQAI